MREHRKAPACLTQGLLNGGNGGLGGLGVPPSEHNNAIRLDRFRFSGRPWRISWRRRPLPFAGLPVVAGITALNHFVAPFIPHHNERG
jgi:hypothetical protein